MRLLLLTASLWALALAKPEMYKESEDFQYSRSSSDEGSKSGFYGAQRGNMGGNYERAHNMDSMAQHHMSTLVRQVDGELGEGANTKTGSVFTAGNSRGIYGSGNYDLSNLKGRNFGESGFYDNSQSSLNKNARYQGNSYAANNARYGSEQSLSSQQSSGYSSSNVESQYSQSGLESENKYHGASNYDHANGGSNMGYYSLAKSQARGAYDQSNTNEHSTYELNNQNRLTSATPVKVYIRPGGRVAIPISAPKYTLYSSNLQDKSEAESSNVLSNSGSEISYKPTNDAKHYQSAYSYHKKWEKHDTQPLLVIPTENPFPANSELYEDRESDRSGHRLQSELSSSNSHLNNINNGYSSLQNYQSGIASSNAHSSKSNSAYSSGFSANTKTTSASRANYQSEDQDKVASASSNALSLGEQNLEASSGNRNHLVEDINSQPKSYHSSFSYHKSWQRQGDPYVITPSGTIRRQVSQKLIDSSQNEGQFSSQQYGSQHNQRRYSNIDCDSLCYQRKKRSYNLNQYQQDLNNGDIHLGQQTEDRWDVGQQTENKFENLEDFGQSSQNAWDNLENLGQQTQNQWNNLGQETQSKWNNLGQQTQDSWDHLTDLGQQAQNEWNNQDNLGQQTENQKPELENLGQKTQDQFSNIEDLGQKTQSQWGALDHDTQEKWDALGQENLSKIDNLEQETQKKWNSLGQQSQKQWSELEDLGQQTQTNWENKQQDLSLIHTKADLEDSTQTQTTDNKNISNQQKKNPAGNNNEPAKPLFLWDILSEKFEQSPKAENSDRLIKNGENESLGNHESNQVFQIEKITSNKQQQGETYLSHHNKNEQTISATDSILNLKPIDVSDKKKLKDSPTESLEIWKNRGTDLDHQSESGWSDFGQQSENHWSHSGQETQNQWSHLGQETQNQWSNLGQETQNLWSNLGQETQNQWSNLGQETQNQWSNLGQETQNQWSNLGQETQNQWSNLGQVTQNQWSHLGQETQNQWSHLGQETQNQWNKLGQETQNHYSHLGQETQNHYSHLGQETQNKWNNLGQQTQNQWADLSPQTQDVWSQIDQQSQVIEGQQQSTNTKKNKTRVEISENVEDQNLKDFFQYFKEENSWNHHSQTTNTNKNDMISSNNVHSENHHVEQVSHDVEQLPHDVEQVSHDVENDSKFPHKTIADPGTTTSSTEVQELPSLHKENTNIGRGDIGADDDSPELGAQITDKQEKPNISLYNIHSTTINPGNNGDKKPHGYSHISNNPSTHKLPVIEELTPDKQNTPSLPNVEEPNIDQQQQFEPQNLELQQAQEDYSVTHVASLSQKPSIQLGRSLETVPLETVTQQHALTISENNRFVEKPLETTSEKPGFWSSVWDKTKNAKSSIVSWFKN